MEQEKVVVKRPHSFAEEALRQGTAYYDYENNANVIPRYLHSHSARVATTSASKRSEEASTVKSSSD
jgi:hypothetical protein